MIPPKGGSASTSFDKMPVGRDDEEIGFQVAEHGHAFGGMMSAGWKTAMSFSLAISFMPTADLASGALWSLSRSGWVKTPTTGSAPLNSASNVGLGEGAGPHHNDPQGGQTAPGSTFFAFRAVL